MSRSIPILTSILAKSFVITVVITVCALLPTIAYSTGIEYISHPMAPFVHFLHTKRILRNLKGLKGITIRHHATTYPSNFKLAIPRTGPAIEEILFYNLTEVQTINDLEQVVHPIVDDTQRKEVHKLLQEAYVTYQASDYKQPGNIVYRYTKVANQWIGKYATEVTAFIKQMHTFYGTDLSSSHKFTIYPCSVPGANTYNFCDKVFLSVSNNCTVDGLNSDLGTVMHEIAHNIYEKQGEALQHAIDKFFLHYPSPYTPLAYACLNEALATVLGNGILMETLTGYSNMSYDNDYIQGLAESIYADVKGYINKQKAMDEALLKKIIQRFARRFPLVKNDLELLWFNSFFEPVWLYQHHSNLPLSGYCTSIQDIAKIEEDKKDRYYNCNALVCFVVTPKEFAMLFRQFPKHPYLSEIPRGKQNYLRRQNQKGVYITRGRHQRPYLFFVVDHQNEFTLLSETLRKNRYMPDAKIGFVELPSVSGKLP